MGHIKHHTIICTSWNKEHIEEARDMATKFFFKHQVGSESLVSELVTYIVNSGYSFFIAPDGSKEDWEPSDNCDNARKEFLDWLSNSDNYTDYIEVMFGGDDEMEVIQRSNNIDFNKEAKDDN